MWGVGTVEVLFEVCRACKGYGGVEGCAGTCYVRCEAEGVWGWEGHCKWGWRNNYLAWSDLPREVAEKHRAMGL